MKTYRALLIDLFWTTVDLDFDRFPSVCFSHEGKEHRAASSGELLWKELAPHGLSADRATFLRQLLQFGERHLKSTEGREEETPSEEKFLAFLDEVFRLNSATKQQYRSLARRFTEIHMDCIVNATTLTDDRRAAIVTLAEAYPLALVSNFDHAPAGHRILREHRLDRLFRAVVISHELGKRKPHRSLFETALEKLGVAPEEALMIGDSPLEDICGAARLSIDTAWVQRSGTQWPAEIETQPTYILSDLKDLRSVLGL